MAAVAGPGRHRFLLRGPLLILLLFFIVVVLLLFSVVGVVAAALEHALLVLFSKDDGAHVPGAHVPHARGLPEGRGADRGGVALLEAPWGPEEGLPVGATLAAPLGICKDELPHVASDALAASAKVPCGHPRGRFAGALPAIYASTAEESELTDAIGSSIPLEGL